MSRLTDRIAQLDCWSGPVAPERLTGGLTNVNYLVEDRGEKFVVRTGDDIPVHRIMRFNELNAAQAAERTGLSPAVIYHEPGLLVMRHIDGRTLTEVDVRDRRNLERVMELVKRCHREMVKELRGPALAFWPFHAIYDYAHTLRDGNSRMLDELPRFVSYAEQLETAVGRGDMVFCHNDLLAGNLLDDGERMWLIDWDYAGFGSPLFDLGGLSSNNQLSDDDERWMLEVYLEGEVPEVVHYRLKAMKAVSLLREAMWSMVSEIHSEIDEDFVSYTQENLDRFDQAWAEFRSMEA
ncbi:MAG: phosphotransferase [Halofilum sp. (in: g-proteobacteria)]